MNTQLLIEAYEMTLGPDKIREIGMQILDKLESAADLNEFFKPVPYKKFDLYGFRIKHPIIMDLGTLRERLS